MLGAMSLVDPDTGEGYSLADSFSSSTNLGPGYQGGVVPVDPDTGLPYRASGGGGGGDPTSFTEFDLPEVSFGPFGTNATASGFVQGAVSGTVALYLSCLYGGTDDLDITQGSNYTGVASFNSDLMTYFNSNEVMLSEDPEEYFYPAQFSPKDSGYYEIFASWPAKLRFYSEGGTAKCGWIVKAQEAVNGSRGFVLRFNSQLLRWS